MIRCVEDPRYHYKTIFNTKTGSYVRFSNKLMASFPHLIDIGVMGKCHHGQSGLCMKAGIKCYQNGLTTNEPNMSLADFKRIIDEIKDKTFQCLDEHEVVLIRNQQSGTISSSFMKDVQVGDWIYDGRDSFVRINAINKKTVNSLVEIKFNYGKTLLATNEHKFPTGRGIKLVSELQVGDTLNESDINLSSNGLDYIDLIKEMVTTNTCMHFYVSGSAIDAICRDYNLKVYRQSKIKSLRLEDIKDIILKYDYSDCVLFSQNTGNIDWKLPITKDLMYLLGHYVGNGSKRTYVISSTQTKMIERIKQSIAVVFPNFAYSINKKNNTTKIEFNSKVPHTMIFDNILKCRTVTGEKQFPNIIWSVSQDLRLWFLRGYFCDGNFYVKKTDGLYGSIVFNTSSLKLSKDICLLLKSMNVGYAVRTYAGEDAIFSKTEQRIIKRKTRYRIYVANFKELIKIKDVVADHKNAEVFYEMVNDVKKEKYLRAVRPLHIESINEINGTFNVVDVNVDSPEHLFMTSHGIISHNCALGGRGDPDMHENFEEILYYAAASHVVPNFTTSGLGMTPEKAAICKAYCGAVAVSMYSRIIETPFVAYRKRNPLEVKTPYKSIDDVPVMFTLNNMNDNCYVEKQIYVINGDDYNWCYLKNLTEEYLNGDFDLYRVYEEKQEPNYTLKAIDMLLTAGVTTNIHYVLSNTTIDEAILRLKYNGFPNGINAVIFLLHKPVGLGDESDVLKYNDPRLVEFFALIDKPHGFKVGFDSCTIPAILNFSKNINLNSIDTCEAARFSMYITSDMIALPCSFDNVNQKYAYNLKDGTIQDAWDSDAFNRFRLSFQTSCVHCKNRKQCLGGCPLEKSITLCEREEKTNGRKK